MYLFYLMRNFFIGVNEEVDQSIPIKIILSYITIRLIFFFNLS